MKCLLVLGALTLLHITLAQKQQYAAPVKILKQINKHNEDGSYSYGYEGADGTFKIETKYADGEVHGKYGYVDDTGKVREVEYGASRRGFEPAGNDINVAPPTLRSQNENQAPLRPGEEDDGQYREDPAIYYKDDAYNRPAYQQQAQQPAYQTQQQQPAYQPQRPAYQSYQQSAYQQPAYQQQQPAYRQPEPEPVYQPQPRPQPAFRPQQQSSSYDFDSFRSSLGFTQKPAPAPTPAPQVYRPTPAPQVYRPTQAPYNNYNQGYSNNNNDGFRNNWWNPGSNYNSGYSNYNQGYRQPIAHEPLPFNVDLNTGSYSLNVGRR